MRPHQNLPFSFNIEGFMSTVHFHKLNDHSNISSIGLFHMFLFVLSLINCINNSWNECLKFKNKINHMYHLSIVTNFFVKYFLPISFNLYIIFIRDNCLKINRVYFYDIILKWVNKINTLNKAIKKRTHLVRISMLEYRSFFFLVHGKVFFISIQLNIERVDIFQLKIHGNVTIIDLHYSFAF